MKRSSLKNRIAAIVGIMAVLVFMMPFCKLEAAASDNTMYATDYEVNVQVNENNSYDFEEVLNIYYATPHHGIYRYIPINGSRISNIRVPGYEYETYTQNGNNVIKIGSGSFTLTGDNEYRVYYTLSMYDDENSEKDMMLINVIPTGWETDIAYAHGVVTLPKETDLSKVQVFSGSYGTEGNEDNVKIETNENSGTIEFSVNDLPARHGITITTELPQGYWVGAQEFGKVSPIMLLLALLGPLGAFILWLLYGRDDHLVKTLEFYPPEDLSPGELGYIIDGSADKEDIVSSIVYMADKGYLTIEEGKGDEFIFRAVQEPGFEVPGFVQTIYNGIFNDGRRDVATSNNLGTRFGKKYTQAIGQLAAMFRGTKAIIRPESRIARVWAAVCAIMPIYAFSSWQSSYGSETANYALVWASAHVLAATWFLCSAYDKIRASSKVITVLKTLAAIWCFTIGLAVIIFDFDAVFSSGKVKLMLMTGMLVLGTLISMFFSIISIARTSRYTELLGKTLGFRDFIKTAEVDKINELVEQDPEYFYHIIPYAYVFGLTNKWIKKFENIPIVQPTWYVGTPRYGSFDGYYMGRMMHNCSSNVANNIIIPAPPAPSGGSFGGGSSGGGWSGGGGFSGGGFSGGGVGGGGGGGW